MQVCTSAHTPAGTNIDPQLFTLKLSDGKTVSLAAKAAHSPALVGQPLAPKQCSTKGWMSFDVPKGAKGAVLEYEFNGKISWNVG
jgi:hypothetical protein